MASRYLPVSAAVTVGALALGALGLAGLAGVLTVDAAPTGFTSGAVTVVGSGFGHGVGMSQYGALGMARAGASAEQILRHYYTGVDVAPVRDDVPIRVNVVDQGSSVTLRSAAVDADGGSWRLVPDGGTPLTLGIGDVVVVTPSSASVGSASARIAGGVPTTRATVPATSGGSSSTRLTVSVRRAPAAVRRPVKASVRVQGGTRLTEASTTFLAQGLSVQWEGTAGWRGGATTLGVTSVKASSGARKGRYYRWGSLQLRSVGTGTSATVDAVAVVDLHSEYLRGVSEVPSSWPSVALQVQAVAARNYALAAARTTPRASCGGCQMWDDTRSQVYVGWAKESERVGATAFGARWVAAVAATQTSSTTGLAVSYRGTPITAYFASSTGGRTRDAADVWGSSVPYLRSVDDPWSVSPAVNPSFARWTRTTSVPRLLSLFGLRDLVSVTVTSRDSGGAAKVVTAVSADGTRKTLSGNVFANRLGLPGAWVLSVGMPSTGSPGSSPTATPTVSATPSGTPTASPAPTSTATPSTTPTVSQSASPSVSSSATPSIRIVVN